jgi:hypothetical protein
VSARSESILAVAICAALLCPDMVCAQGDIRREPAAPGVSLSPTLVVRDLGWDSNIVSTKVPRGDATSTIGLHLKPTIRSGMVAVDGTSVTEAEYFRDASSQRSLNTSNSARLWFGGDRFSAYASGGYVRSRDVFTAEVDARAYRIQLDEGTGADFRVSSRTRLFVSAQHTRFMFGSDDPVFGATLQETLDRRERAVGATFSYRLTPLTTMVFTNQRQTDRFTRLASRDADGWKTTIGLSFKPGALLVGQASAGYRVFSHRPGGAAAVDAVVAAVQIDYVMAGSIRVRGAFDRDVQPSLRPDEDYYLSTRLAGTVTKRLTKAMDLAGSVSRQRIDYQSQLFAASLLADADLVLRSGMGITYRLGPATEFTVQAEYAQRDSTQSVRRYSRLRTVCSFSYRL